MGWVMKMELHDQLVMLHDNDIVLHHQTQRLEHSEESRKRLETALDAMRVEVREMVRELSHVEKMAGASPSSWQRLDAHWRLYDEGVYE